MNKQLVKRLREIRERYTSLEEMAEALRPHPGFEGLNRATLFRWFKKPSPRALVAVQIFESRRSASRLRIGESNTLSVLPSSMLTWDAEEGKPYGLLERRYGVRAQVQRTRTGGDAFELLVKGKAEIALVPADLLSQLGPDCRRLCLLTKLHVTGFATEQVEGVFDLKEKTFGFLSGSAFGLRLEHLSRAWGLALPPPAAMKTSKDCAQALLDGQISGMMGSEPSVSQVRRAVERSLHVFPIPQGVLGFFEMHVAVNLKIAHPDTVRAYLCGLKETVPYTNARKSVTAFQTEVASRFNMDPWDVRNVLANTTFVLGDFDPATILALWEREAVHLRKT